MLATQSIWARETLPRRAAYIGILENASIQNNVIDSVEALDGRDVLGKFLDFVRHQILEVLH